MSSEVNLMTRGSIYKQITYFALPLFWGQVFQQLYNAVDCIVVGQFVGRSALAAVSSTGSLVQLFVGFLVGVFVGAGVVISKYFGAKNEEMVRKSIHTLVAFALASGALISVLGALLAPKVLVLMDTPANVLAEAVTYLRIYFCGGIFLALYNSASGIFQAVGDSRHPLYYLIFSSVLNVALDLLFVAVFHMGVAGAAIATVISQAAGVVLAFRRLLFTNKIYKVVIKKIQIDLPLVREILFTGIPAGVQNSVISLANVVVQSNVNIFGDIAVAGFGASSKIQGFAFIPVASFSMALTTFTGQNLGAKEYERAKKGARFGILACCGMAAVIGAIYYITAPLMISLFNSEAGVIAVGTQHARTIGFFMFLMAFSHCAAGILRGAGRAVVPMLVMLGCWCVFRVAYITVVTYFIPDISVIFWAYPITWAMSTVFFVFALLKSDWVHGLEHRRPTRLHITNAQ